jgi:hypothetical protein
MADAHEDMERFRELLRSLYSLTQDDLFRLWPTTLGFEIARNPFKAMMCMDTATAAEVWAAMEKKASGK